MHITVSHEECERRYNQTQEAMMKALEYWRDTLSENANLRDLLRVALHDWDIDHARIKTGIHWTVQARLILANQQSESKERHSAKAK